MAYVVGVPRKHGQTSLPMPPLFLAIVGLLLIGCQPQQRATRTAPSPSSSSGQTIEPPQTQPDARADAVAPISNTDACASRLHDLCEPLLLYYATRHEIPPRLEDLRQMPGFSELDLRCPVSRLPYIYNPVGIQTGDDQPRLVIYDAAPSHSGMRWAIAIVEPKDPANALVAKVVAVPERRFTFKSRP
jgi:hypothetical protein